MLRTVVVVRAVCSLVSVGLFVGCGSGSPGDEPDADGLDAILDGDGADVARDGDAVEAEAVDDGDTGCTCDDGNPCTDDSCDPATGRCVFVANTAPCSDGNACTTGERCADGRCAPGTPLACNDGNVCTDDSCNSATGCVFAPNTMACNDGNACTTGDRCSDGACIGTTLCNDGNVCTDDSCNPASGACTFTENAAPCEDDNPCTTGDRCSGGACWSGTGGPAWHPDTDGDGFGDPGATPVCAATPPAGYVADSTDCCDERNDVNPDQLAFSATSYTCGGGATYDYDCNGLEEAHYLDAGGDCRRTGTTCTAVPGWQGATTPSCGSSRSYVMGCDASCRPIVETRTQECR